MHILCVISLWYHTVGNWCLVVIGVQIFLHSFLEFLVHYERVFLWVLLEVSVCSCTQNRHCELSTDVRGWAASCAGCYSVASVVSHNWLGRWMGSRTPVTKRVYTFIFALNNGWSSKACGDNQKLSRCAIKFSKLFKVSPVPVAARSKAWVCGYSPAEIVGSNLAEGMDVCLL